MRVWLLGAPVLVLALGWARADEPLQFAPDEVRRPDGGAPADTTPAPQAQDREAPPLAPATPPGKAPSPPATPSAPATVNAPAPAQAPAPVTTSPVHARDQKPAPLASTALRAPIVPPRITVHAWEPEKATLFAPEATVEQAMGDVLEHDQRLRFTPFSSLLAVDDAQEKLAQADADNKAAGDALTQMDLDHAQALLESALKGYQRYMPQLAARPDGTTPMRDAWIRMAQVRFFNGNQDGARDALRYALVLDGKLTFNKELFPQAMKKLLVESRLLYDTLGPGKLVIDSDPPGATVWLDGRELPQPAPTDPIDAPPGPNYISYARRGYAPMTLVFEVPGGGEAARAVQTLERYPKNPLAPIDRARAHIDDTRTPPTLKEACALLGVDMLVLVRVERPGVDADETPARLVAYLYDARPDKILKRVEQPVAGALDESARKLGAAIVSDVPLDGVLVAPPAPRGPSWSQRFAAGMRHDFSRFYHWKGFWYVVGGVAALAVAGVAGGVGGNAYEQERAARQRQIGTGVVLIGGN